MVARMATRTTARNGCRVDDRQGPRTVIDTMLSIGPISAIEARLAAIRQRIAPQSAAATNGTSQAGFSLDSVAPDPVASGFDPFGAVYQAALEARPSLQPTSVFASGTGGAYTEGVVGTTGASVGKIGGYGPMPVPTELAGLRQRSHPRPACCSRSARVAISCTRPRQRRGRRPCRPPPPRASRCA